MSLPLVVSGGPAGTVSEAPQKPTVVLATDPLLRQASKTPDRDRVLRLLDTTVQTFFQRDDPISAYRLLAKPTQTVGLKVNCLAGHGISTHRVLVEALCQRLQEAGIGKKNIIIWDRLSRDLDQGGFEVVEKGPGIRCFGNDLLGFDPDLQVHGSVGSLLCRTLTQACDVVINLPVLKDHGITGVTGALKNLFGAIHNPNKYHLNVGDPYIADVWMLPPVRQKVTFTICDALTAQYNGGPSFMPHWTWPFNSLLASADPVALDSVVWKIVEDKRREEGMASLKKERREPVYIARAADQEHRLGTNLPDQYRVIERKA